MPKYWPQTSQHHQHPVGPFTLLDIYRIFRCILFVTKSTPSFTTILVSLEIFMDAFLSMYLILIYFGLESKCFVFIKNWKSSIRSNPNLKHSQTTLPIAPQVLGFIFTQEAALLRILLWKLSFWSFWFCMFDLNESSFLTSVKIKPCWACHLVAPFQLFLLWCPVAAMKLTTVMFSYNVSTLCGQSISVILNVSTNCGSCGVFTLLQIREYPCQSHIHFVWK